MANIALATHP